MVGRASSMISWRVCPYWVELLEGEVRMRHSYLKHTVFFDIERLLYLRGAWS
jgi:hypothetical protein